MACIVVTGTNKGIGLQICAQLKERGDDVIARSAIARWAGSYNSK